MLDNRFQRVEDVFSKSFHQGFFFNVLETKEIIVEIVISLLLQVNYQDTIF